MAGAAQADSPSTDAATNLSCPVTYSELKSALVLADKADKTGFQNHFWAVVVNRAGVVCAVAFSGADTGSQWLSSRTIAAAKAFTANGLSLNIPSGTGALSTAQLYQFVQPSNAYIGNPLFGLEGGNVLNSQLAYQGNYAYFGTTSDPMIGQRIGGTITFGGGLALYTSNGTVVGGLGLSGDTACRDHSVAWRTRIILKLEQSKPKDQLPFATNAAMTNGHPHCPNDAGTVGTN
ncbi:MAG TPA: heme-binding protein [Methylocella sp.]|nr:heme-binding protein [Methylocella sp.]